MARLVKVVIPLSKVTWSSLIRQHWIFYRKPVTAESIQSSASSRTRHDKLLKDIQKRYNGLFSYLANTSSVTTTTATSSIPATSVSCSGKMTIIQSTFFVNPVDFTITLVTPTLLQTAFLVWLTTRLLQLQFSYRFQRPTRQSNRNCGYRSKYCLCSGWIFCIQLYDWWDWLNRDCPTMLTTLWLINQ